MTKTANYQLNQWGENDYVKRADFNADNQKIDAAIKANADAAANIGSQLNTKLSGMAKIAAGSYTGTGTYGTNGKSTLTFSFTPHIVILNTGNPDPYNDVSRYFMLLRPAAQYLFDRNHAGGLTWGEKSVAWNSDDAEHQFNESGKTYHYIAIGTV